MSDTPARYTFVPWLRRGIAARIEEADHLGTDPDAGPVGRAGLSIELVVDYETRDGSEAAALPAISRRVELVGPGDALGIKSSAVLRTVPPADSPHATPGELAFVEFFDEDFPWRYTPARVAREGEAASARHKLRPWLSLFVLRAGEFTLTERPGESSVLDVADATPLPPVEEAWAWAHAQVGQAVSDPASLDAVIAAAPERSLSRLMCPRKLEAGVSYTAFIVPAFESGRLAGLKEPDPGTPAQKPSWGVVASGRRFPVYFSWSFKTGEDGDFETLARKLVAGAAGPAFGRRTMDVSDPGYGLPVVPGATVGLEGALCPPQFSRRPFPDAHGSAFTRSLRALVDLSQDLQSAAASDLTHPLGASGGRTSAYPPSLRATDPAAPPDDPIVTPPAYGRLHADVRRIADAASEPDLAWLLELNLDARSRVAAGLGTEVVRQYQEEFMARAWEQVGQIEAANQRLREAELAAAAGDALHAKHLLPMDSDRVLTLTTAAQRGLRAPTDAASVRGVMAASRVPTAAQTATFKRLARPQRKLVRRLTDNGAGAGLQDAILQKMNLEATSALSTARPKADPPAAIALSAVSAALGEALGTAIAKPEAKTWFMELLAPILGPQLPNLVQPGITATIQVLARTALRAATGRSAEAIALAGRVRALIDAMTAVSADGPSAAIVTLTPAAYKLEFGDVAGKTYGGVTVVPEGLAPGGDIARAVGLKDLQAYTSALGQFGGTFVNGRPLPTPTVAVGSLPALANHVRDRLHPAKALRRSVAVGVEGLAEALSGRGAGDPRPLRPVMAAPVFDDPMMEPLRRLSQQYILPNVTDLPRDSLTLMEPNTRFIEAYMAGLNVEMARELLWRGYPTDQRGTCMRVFWDTRDADGHLPHGDILPIDRWSGALGSQSQTPAEPLVLVIRGDLFLKYPNTVVYAQEAQWTGGDRTLPRSLKPGGTVMHPIFQVALEPDIAVFGFDHPTKVEALGNAQHPGWFFVLKERPGQVRFGADALTPATGLSTWDDLAWDRIPLADGGYARIAGTGVVPPQPADAAGVSWGATSAHLAYALFQSPVLCARHAAEMLPPKDAS